MGRVLMAILLGFLSGTAAGETPHQAASRCFDRHTADCEATCALCHERPAAEALGPASFYADFDGDFDLDFDGRPSRQPASVGDIPICMQCHPERATPGQNHPVGILYPNQPGGEFIPQPEGPKLFCDDLGVQCWIFCSTCHDPHNARGLVRRKAPGAPLCQACHIK